MDSKTCVVHNAVPANNFDFNIKPNKFLAKNKLSPNTPKILFLGGLSKEKGTHVILDSFSLVLKKIPNAQLLIAGPFNTKILSKFSLKQFFPASNFKKSITKKIKLLAKSVILLGPIQNVPEAMAASQVIVFPATVGHFARPVIEAGFMKKPVVASNIPPLNELVIHGKTGLLVDPNNYQEFASSLHKVIINTDYHKKIGQEAFDFCSKNFSIEKHISSIQNVYEKIITKKGCS
jgi:glycosyltransferase involved in cell wall biosynthesis